MSFLSDHPQFSENQPQSPITPLKGVKGIGVALFIFLPGHREMSGLSLTASAVIRPFGVVLRGETKDKSNEEKTSVHSPR